MTRLPPILVVVAVSAVVAACGSRKTQTRAAGPAGSADTGEEKEPGAPVPIKQIVLAWSLEPTTSAPPKTRVAIATTDEMGRVANHVVGEFDGTCTDVGPIELYRADTAVTCGQSGKGVQLHAVAGRGEVVVYEMDIAEGTEPDPMARRQIARVEVPVGAKISVGP